MRFRALFIAFLAVCLGIVAFNRDALAVAPSNLTYDQVKGTGLAINCPTLEGISTGSIPIEGNASITDLCLQPTQFYVKEESTNRRKPPEFVPTPVMTRLTYTLEQINGSLSTSGEGITFKEEGGIDFQAITVRLPDGERVPFLFTVKELIANSSGSDISRSTTFIGKYTVPSYRTSGFLDPKGRGLTVGYDTAVGLPATGDAVELDRANVKRFDVSEGEMVMQIEVVDPETEEFAGTFVSEQVSDTDMGAADPKEVKIEGIFYGRIA